jgi:hypothetical protein
VPDAAAIVDCVEEAGPGPVRVKLELVAAENEPDVAVSVYEAVSNPPRVQFVT